MALALGTNVGFVTTAPTADPAGTGATSNGSSFVVKDTAPTGAIKITEVGWYKAAGTTSSNTQVGLYAADGATVPGEAGTRLQVTADQASGTSANVWIRFTGLNWPVTAGTAYWLGMQQDAHTGSSQIDSAASGGSGIDTRTSQTALTNPYGGGALSDVDGMYAIYAVYQSAPTVTLSSPADTATGVSTTPDLVFTGTDANSDDVRYEVQVDTTSTFNGNILASDDFNRTNENPISGNWTNNALNEGADNQLQIVSNQLKAATSATSCEAYYNASTFNGYIENYYTIVTKPGNGNRLEIGLFTSMGAGYDGYRAIVIEDTGGTDTYEIARFDNESQTILASGSNEFNTSDVLSLRYDPQAGNLEMLINGSVIDSATDTTYASGPFYAYIGIKDTTAVLDNWGVRKPLIDAVSGTDAGFSGTPDNTDPFTSGQAVTYTVQSALSNSTLYYWRVRGIDPSGSNIYGAWATTRSFTTAAAGGGGATPATGFMTVNTGFWGA